MVRLVDKWLDHDDLLLRDVPDDEQDEAEQDDDHSDEWFQRYED